jgi:hypothetical protein
MYYDTCRRYEGKVVKIKDRRGQVHIGKITKVENDRVWIEPTSHSDSKKYKSKEKKDRATRCANKKSRSKKLDDFHNNSYFYGGGGECFDDNKCGRRKKRRGCECDSCSYGGGYGRGSYWGGGGGYWGYPIAFGFITGIALAALFFF